MKLFIKPHAVAAIIVFAITAFSTSGATAKADKNAQQSETAQEFVARIEQESLELSKELNAAFWVRSTYINKDTAVLAAKAGERALEFESKVVSQAKKFKGSQMDAETARAIELMLRGSSAPAPDDPEAPMALENIAKMTANVENCKSWKVCSPTLETTMNCSMFGKAGALCHLRIEKSTKGLLSSAMKAPKHLGLAI